MRDPHGPATLRQRWALMITTNVDLDKVVLTKSQASQLLDHVTEGRDATVRNVLITLGGVAEGDLPDPDEVLVMRKLGRTTLVLPLGVDVPKHAGKVWVEQTPEGHLLIKSTATTESRGQGH